MADHIARVALVSAFCVNTYDMCIYQAAEPVCARRREEKVLVVENSIGLTATEKDREKRAACERRADALFTSCP